MERLQPLVGLLLIGLIAYALSTNRRAIRVRTIVWGFGLQFVFGVIVLRTSQGQWMFEKLGDKIRQLLEFAAVGSSFVFGPIGNQPVWARIMTNVLGPEGAQYGVIFAFQIAPTIIFIAALFAILYYLGVMQIVVRLFAVVMNRVMGASGAESLNVAASIFMGQTEAPLTIRPYLPKMTRVRADDGDDVRHGAHLGRHHGGVHRVRHRAQASAHGSDHDGPGHADAVEDVRARDGRARDDGHASSST